MELCIWSGGRWRAVSARAGRVAGWRRRARFVAAGGGVLREISGPQLLQRLRKGPRVPTYRRPDAKPMFKIPLSRFKQPLFKFQKKSTIQKDASVQTDTESMQASPAVKPAPAIDNADRISLSDDKENRAKKRTSRSVSTEVLAPIHKRQKLRKISPDIKKDQQKKLFRDPKRNEETENTTATESQSSQSCTEEDSQFKELIILEEDIITLRHYIETHDTNIDLYKFDTNDNYKSLVFYKLNPLVKVSRCPKIAQMIIDREISATVQFARQLGLRSVADSDSEKEKRRRSRRIETQRTSMVELSSSSDSDDAFLADKYYKTKKTRSEATKKTRSEESRSESTKKTRSEETKKTRSEDNKKTRSDVSTKRRSEDSKKKREVFKETTSNTDTEAERSENKQAKKDRVSADWRELMRGRDGKWKPRGAENRKPEKASSLPPKIVPKKRPGFVTKRSSVPPGREYSSLEDQAIVAWLSASSGRERAVNGNRLWRELQGEYYRITGQSRSWHSLRNRYLRYILPALGSLALPPHQAQRLRAHANMGELKARKLARSGARAPPAPPAPRGAFARRPREPLASSPEPQGEIESPPTPPPRALRSSLPPSPPARALRSSWRGRSPSPPPAASPPRSPRYSEVTRRFALRQRSTPQDSNKKEAPASAPLQRGKRRLYNPTA